MKLSHFGFILIFLLCITSINATHIDEISKDDLKDIKYFNNNSNISLEAFNFTIPKGFGLIENESINHTEGNYTNLERFFANDDGKIIMISASSIVRQDLTLSDYTPSDVDMNRYAIKGHDGIEWSMNNATYFIYFDSGYLITVGAPKIAILKASSNENH